MSDHLIKHQPDANWVSGLFILGVTTFASSVYVYFFLQSSLKGSLTALSFVFIGTSLIIAAVIKAVILAKKMDREGDEGTRSMVKLIGSILFELISVFP